MMRRKIFFCFLFYLSCLLLGCAYTEVEGESQQIIKDKSASILSFPQYKGPKTVVAVLPLGLSKRAAERYPHLLEKDVGFGVHNMVVDALYETRRFRLVEEKPEIIKEVLNRQWMSSAGMVDEGTAIKLGRILGAKKVIYGEVYDYAEGGERVVGFSARSGFRVRVGVQIRYVDVETLEYVPASGVGYGYDFGSAAKIAINKAVLKLIERISAGE